MSGMFKRLSLVAILTILGTKTIQVGKCMPNEFKIDSVAKYKATEMTDEMIEEENYFDSLETLAICVEAEAGNQDLMGKRLVVDVILNRVDSSRFPDDIISVITQKSQFSSYSNGSMDRVIEPSEETFEAVRMELENRTDSEILFFTADRYNSHCVPAYKYGDHYFGY